jgi:hypothetical protein
MSKQERIIEGRSYKALSVKQPYAEAIANGHKTIEVRSRNTTYRGDLVICSSAKPFLPGFGLPAGVTICVVELYDVKPVEEFTAEDWAATCIPPDDQPLEGFGWLVRNPRRVEEIPVKGQLGIYNLVVSPGEQVVNTIKGWVARDGYGSLAFSNMKPSRIKLWKLWKVSSDTPAVVLPSTLSPSLRWEDEPKPVRIIIEEIK